MIKKDYSQCDDKKKASLARESGPLLQCRQNDVSDFLAQIKGKEVFGKHIAEAVPVSGEDHERIEKIKENLRVVGIIAEDSPQAIIEDKTTAKSYYVRAGDQLEENISVYEIKKDSVILDCYGENLEIYL